ncbi:hypothetical protein TEA_025650 [Camellia sinensis var. sinensis]|uniref:Uncharacterized protein n=1 Tax=Camellia sinensis var. sinensis TaxID=542762 RepID=A0A4S4F1M4_CAMSN|nr:hypothetical protein TEA_025650 [Camellia sinensis var. sinensis]
MAIFFSLTTPVGIAIGIGISSSYNENSPTALAVEGILNAASAGILIYMALVDLLSVDFMNPRMQANRKLQLGANASLLFGAGSISEEVSVFVAMSKSTRSIELYTVEIWASSELQLQVSQLQGNNQMYGVTQGSLRPQGGLNN